MCARLVAALSIALILAACQAPPDQSGPGPAALQAYGVSYLSAGQACAEFGSSPTSADFTLCIANQHGLLSVGQAARDDGTVGLVSGTCEACNAYDLEMGHDM